MTAARQIQINHLRALAEVAAAGSLTRAAANLGYTEPAIHLQLAALRKAVGGSVVERSDGRMVLTELGLRILPFAIEAIEAVEQVMVAAEQVHASERHTLRIGVGRGTGIYLFPRIAATISALLPGITLESAVLKGEEILEALADQRIDVAITSDLRGLIQSEGRARRGEVALVPLLSYRWAFLTAPHLAGEIAGGRRPGVPILLPEWASRRLESTLDLVAALELGSQLGLATHTEAAKATALAGNAIAFVPGYTARHELLSGELVTCFDQLPEYETCLYLGHRRPTERPDVRRFVGHLRQVRPMLRALVSMPEISTAAPARRVTARTARRPGDASQPVGRSTTPAA